MVGAPPQAAPRLDKEGADGLAIGGRAAMEVYQVIELRQRIFSLVDRNTLVRMLVLEKSGLGGISDLLFEDIHERDITWLDRSSPRRETWCSSVRTVDRSPPAGRTSPEHTPSRNYTFDSGQLRRDISTLLSIFPRLRTIFHEYPLDSAANPTTAHIRGDRILLELETRVQFDMSEPSPSTGTPVLPEPPVYEGMEVRHILSISVIGGRTPRGQSFDEPWTDAFKREELARANVGRWRAWLFDNPDLDRRVVAVHVGEQSALKTYPYYMSLPEIVTLILHRRKPTCEPLREIDLPDHRNMTVDTLRAIADLWRPELRRLRIQATGANDLRSIVNILSKTSPFLRHLDVPVDSTKIPRDLDTRNLPNFLPKLREIRFWDSASGEENPLGLARFLSRLGSNRCSYDPGPKWLPSHKHVLKDIVRRLRSNRPEYYTLHTIDPRHLDIWTSRDMIKLRFDSTGRAQRVASSESAAFSESFAKKQNRLEELLADQRDAAAGVQYALNAATEASGRDGDAMGGRAIRENFESLKEQQKKWLQACKAVRDYQSTLAEAADEAVWFATAWLQKDAKRDQ